MEDTNDLIIEAKNGDKMSFCKLIKKMEKSLYKIARAKLNNEEDIEDAVQETIVLTYKHIKDLKDINKFKSWLIKILINNCYKVYKTRKKYSTQEYDESINADTDKKIDQINSGLYFDFLMKQLNEDEKIAITLYYVEGFSNKEISQILKVNEGTIKSRISRGKEKIKKFLNKENSNG